LIKQDKSQDQELAIFKIKKTIFKVLVKSYWLMFWFVI
jgi:hypothetical protein